MYENLSQIMVGVFAVILGIGVLWALLLGFKQIALHFKDYKNYRGSVLSKEEAAEVKELVEAMRAKMQAEKAAQK
jgi:cytochrome bd-type quinol oxidase subunit 1